MKRSKQSEERPQLKRKEYERELEKLQARLCRLQDWVVHKGLRVIVLFEGRDAAGKGGAIKAVTQCLNPRVCRVVALGTPTDTDGSALVYAMPGSKETALAFPDLAAGESQAIWIRRQVLAGQQLFETSAFQLAVFGFGPSE